MKLADYFEPCIPSAESTSARNRGKMSARDMWWYVAPVGIAMCLDPESAKHTFAVREIYHHVPGLQPEPG